MSRTFSAITEAPREVAGASKPAETPWAAPPAPAPKPAAPRAAPPKLAPAPKAAADDLMDDSSIPFIEVGGPRARAQAAEPRIYAPPANEGKLSFNAPPAHAGSSLAHAPLQTPPAYAGGSPAVNSQVVAPPVVEARLEFDPRPIRLLNVSFQALPDVKLYGPGGAQIGSDVVTYHQPNHPVSGQYLHLQHQIAGQLPKADRALIVLTSARGGAGASTAALNIAISRAFDQKGRVLLLDANPGQPTLASRIGCADMPGLSELLAQTSPVGLALQPTELPNLQLLAWGRSEKRLGDAEWAKLPAVVARLMQRFEWIIVDAPHQIEGLKRWIGLTDGIYLVVRQEEWDSPHVDQAHEVIRTLGGKIRGCLMTAA